VRVGPTLAVARPVRRGPWRQRRGLQATIVGGEWTRLDAVVLELLRQVCDLAAQVRILRLHSLCVAAHRGAAGDAVGGLAWRPVLLARRASLWPSIAADFADLGSLAGVPAQKTDVVANGAFLYEMRARECSVARLGASCNFPCPMGQPG
jgi:hypothetical protein